MADQRYVNYIRQNRAKYSIDALRQALLKAKVPPAVIEDAIREATAPAAPASPPPVVPPPVSPEQAQAAAAAQAGAAGPVSAPAGTPHGGGTGKPFDPKSLVATVKRVLTDPAGFFRTMPKQGGWKEPALFLVAMVVAAQIASLILGVGFRVFTGWSIVKVILGSMGAFIGGLIMLPIGIMIGLVIAHVIWMILGSKENIETSFRCVCYMAAITPVSAFAGALPWVGVWVAIPVTLYGLYLFVPASIEVHGIAKKKAVLVFAVVGGLMFLMQFGSAVAVWKLKKAGRAFDSSMAKSFGTSSRRSKSGKKASSMDLIKGIVQMGQQLSKTQGGAPAEEMDTTEHASAPGEVSGAPGDPSEPPPVRGDDYGISSGGGGEAPVRDMKAAANQFMAALGADGKVQAVDGKRLKTLLPARLPGMKRVSMKSSRQKMGRMNVSVAEAVYRGKKKATITVKVSDAGSMSKFLTMAWAFVDLERESEDGFERTLEYKGAKAHEKYNTRTRSGLFETVVAERFVVKVEGRRVKMEAIRAAAERIDLGDLAGLAQ